MMEDLVLHELELSALGVDHGDQVDEGLDWKILAEIVGEQQLAQDQGAGEDECGQEAGEEGALAHAVDVDAEQDQDEADVEVVGRLAEYSDFCVATDQVVKSSS